MHMWKSVNNQYWLVREDAGAKIAGGIMAWERHLVDDLLFATLSENNRKEDIPMTTQGLLVKGTHGEDYLLTTEPNRGTRTHRLVVLKKANDRWQPMEGIDELVCREALIAAFVDFVVDLCRVLNSSDRRQAEEPALLPEGRT
jgi:hypothetical protein